MATTDDESERPATWENVVVGKAEEVVGKLIRDDDLERAGETEVEVAHQVREDFEREHGD